ncbi:MAG: hypothetical protein JOZ07_14955 [Solirubrobacterales bacterium]|nr:hypothetical protein [Solirubrobacterales bacterium]
MAYSTVDRPSEIIDHPMIYQLSAVIVIVGRRWPSPSAPEARGAGRGGASCTRRASAT